MALSAIWLAIGCAGLLVHANALSGEPWYHIVVWPAAFVPAWATRSAHGPPFLTVAGVLGFYVAPALVMGRIAWRARLLSKT